MRVADPTLNITTLPAPPRPAARLYIEAPSHFDATPTRQNHNYFCTECYRVNDLHRNQLLFGPVLLAAPGVSLHVPVERVPGDVITSAKLLSRQTTRFEITD